MKPSPQKILLGFFCFLISALHRLWAQVCIGVDRIGTTECSYCASGFIRNKDYFSAEPGDFNSIPSFSIDECQQRSLDFLFAEREIFVADRECVGSTLCRGTQLEPFGNLMQGLKTAHELAKQYESSKIIITLLGDYHYLMEAHLLSSASPSIHFFRRSRTSIEIRASPQAGRRATLILKTNRFFLFVSGSLVLTNLIIDGSDLNLGSDQSCKQAKKVCCSLDALSTFYTPQNPCGLRNLQILSPSPNWNLGFVNLEFLFDGLPLRIPEVRIANCSFENFTPLDSARGYASVISSERGLPGGIIIENSTFTNCHLFYGLLSVQAAKNTNFFKITPNASSALIYSTIAADNPISLLTISSSNFSKYSISELSSQADGTFALINVKNIETEINLSNNTFLGIIKPASGLLFIMGAEPKRFNSSILLKNNVFDSNSLLYQMDVKGYGRIVHTDNLFINNTWSKFATVFATGSSFANDSFTDSVFKSSSFFQIQETKLTLNSIQMSNTVSLALAAYLVYCSFPLSGSMDDVITNYSPLTKAFTRDSLIIQNSSLQKGNFLIFKNAEASFAVEISGSLFSDLVPLSSSPFFVITVEHQFAVWNTQFTRIKNYGSFIIATYSKNLTFINSSIENSTLFDGFDFFIATKISSTNNKVISNFTNSSFRNINIYKPKGFTLRFIQFHLFSRECGFYIALFLNCVFEEIVCQTCTPDDYLFYTATQITKLVQSSFIDIGGLSIQQYFPRMPESSEFSLWGCAYILKRYPVFLILLTSLDYNPKDIIIADSYFEGSKPMEGNNAISFLNIETFTLRKSTFKNVISKAGNTITVKPHYLSWLIVDACRFVNNSGKGVQADLMIEISVDEAFDWQSFQDFPNGLRFGILNSVFEGSQTGSVGVIKSSQMIILNCSFYNIVGAYGGIVNTLPGVSVLLKDVLIKSTRVIGMGGAVYLFESKLFLFNLKVERTQSTDFGGFIASFSSFVLIRNTLLFQVASEIQGGAVWADKSEIICQNSTFDFGSSEIQGGHFYIKDTVLNLSNTSLQNGRSLSSSSIYSFNSHLIFKKVEISNCFSSVSKGFGAIMIAGNKGKDIVLEQMTCSGNQGMTGSCLYVKDARLVINSSSFSDNQGDQGSVVQIVSGDQRASLLLVSCVFKQNDLSYGIISSLSASLTISSCLFANNSVSGFYIKMFSSSLEILRTNLAYSSSLKTPRDACLIIISSVKNASLNSLEIVGLSLASLLQAENCEAVKITSVIFAEGFSQKACGGLYLVNSSSVLLNLTFRGNKAVANGGAVCISKSRAEVVGAKFLNNEAGSGGADVFIELCNDIDKVSMSSNQHFNFNGTSIHSYQSEVAIVLSNFSNLLSMTSLAFHTLFMQDCSNITLDRIFFTNASRESFIRVTNEEASGLIAVHNCVFNKESIKNKSSLNGALINIRGPCGIVVTNSLFQGGETDGSGGAVAYECSSVQGRTCFMSLEGSTEFRNNRGGKFGNALYAPFTKVSFGNQVKINRTPGSKEIYTVASRLVIVANVSTEEDVVLKADECITNFMKNPDLENTETIKCKSGIRFKLGIIVIDDYGNMITENSQGTVEMTLQRNSSSASDGTLQATVCEMENGYCLFREVFLIGTARSSFKTILKYTAKEFEITRPLTIYLTDCSKGEVVVDRICMSCSENLYSLTDDFSRDPNPQCLSCPKNAECPGGSLVIPKAGYWRKDENSSVVLVCHYGEASCPYQSSWRAAKVQDQLSFMCADEYYGPLCQMCKIGFGAYKDGCYPCASDHAQNFSLAAKIIFALALISWECHTLLSKAQSRYKTFLKIIVMHTNYMIAVVNLNLSLSSELKEVVGSLNSNVSVVPADIFNFECILRGALEQDQIFLGNSVLRLLCILFYAFMAFVLKILLDLFLSVKKGKAGLFFITFGKRASYTFFVIFLITFRNMYPRVLKSLISILKCLDIGAGDGKFVMFENPNILCHESEHMKLIMGVTFPGLLTWTIFVPTAIFRFIYLRRSWVERRNNFIVTNTHKEKKEKTLSKNDSKSRTVKLTMISETFTPVENETSAKIESKKSNTISNQDKIAKKDRVFFILTFEYRGQTYYWALVENLIIFLLLLISQLISDLDEISKRLVIFICFCLVYLLYQYKNPYWEVSHYRAVCASILIIISTITFELIGSLPEASSAAKQISRILVILLNTSFYGICGLTIIWSLWMDKKGLFLTLISSFKSSNTKKKGASESPGPPKLQTLF